MVLLVSCLSIVVLGSVGVGGMENVDYCIINFENNINQFVPVFYVGRGPIPRGTSISFLRSLFKSRLLIPSNLMLLVGKFAWPKTPNGLKKYSNAPN